MALIGEDAWRFVRLNQHVGLCSVDEELPPRRADMCENLAARAFGPNHGALQGWNRGSPARLRQTGAVDCLRYRGTGTDRWPRARDGAPDFDGPEKKTSTREEVS